jgi:hypothetical protein
MSAQNCHRTVQTLAQKFRYCRIRWYWSSSSLNTNTRAGQLAKPMSSRDPGIVNFVAKRPHRSRIPEFRVPKKVRQLMYVKMHINVDQTHNKLYTQICRRSTLAMATNLNDVAIKKPPLQPSFVS